MTNIFGQPINPLAHPALDMFLLGFIAALSLIAALYFLRFWRATRDIVFLSFVLFFLVQGCIEGVDLTLPHPNLGSVWIFIARLLSILAVLAAILAKNSGS